MLRIIRRRISNGGEENTFYKLLFALAIALKVTPKLLANAFDKEKHEKYAVKFREELEKHIEKRKADADKLTSRYNKTEKKSRK